MSEKKDQWAIVELFGHQRIAGKISEHAVGGCSFVRIDVPEFNGRLFHAGQDIEALVARKDDIASGDLMTLRMRQKR